MASPRHVAAWCIMLRMLAVCNRKTLAERHFVTVTAAEMLRLQARLAHRTRRFWPFVSLLLSRPTSVAHLSPSLFRERPPEMPPSLSKPRRRKRD